MALSRDHLRPIGRPGFRAPRWRRLGSRTVEPEWRICNGTEGYIEPLELHFIFRDRGRPIPYRQLPVSFLSQRIVNTVNRAPKGTLEELFTVVRSLQNWLRVTVVPQAAFTMSVVRHNWELGQICLILIGLVHRAVEASAFILRCPIPSGGESFGQTTSASISSAARVQSGNLARA